MHAAEAAGRSSRRRCSRAIRAHFRGGGAAFEKVSRASLGVLLGGALGFEFSALSLELALAAHELARGASSVLLTPVVAGVTLQQLVNEERRRARLPARA